ncbi:MAG: fused MFS/spermidine synthase [Armatimonadetes bacterium]|nr:fused MFS/spermidine synthase [Armatimonadota bacterium]MCX7966972.1 fused MFS/spermidine synthase [Armatimonadota bacterium]MDW8142129.1 fused MFS/spermidine synthase [Armatimonadota bacterium]
MIWIIAFFCGAIVMVLEIAGGARLLAPHFGSGAITWASVISVFLAGLSVGYFLGGMIADKFPTPNGLGILLVLAAINIGLISPMTQWLFPEETVIGVGGVPMPVENIFERVAGRYGVLLAATILFSLPSILLGTVSPYLIRLASKGVETAGRTAGSIYAVSTVGSIVGTLGCAFVLLPKWGVSAVLMQMTGATLFVAILCFVAGKSLTSRRSGRVHLTCILTLFLLIASLSFAQVIYRRDSLYHRIIVEDVANVRYLRFDASYQSAMDLKDPDRAVFAYTDYLHLCMLFKPDAKKVLFVGLGGATAQKKFHKDYPQMVVHTAEIDPAVKEVAEKFFNFREDERMKVFIEDGRVYLRKAKERYDIIILDAYFGSRYEVTLPFHLVTREFWWLAQSRLTDDGIVVFNLVGRLEGFRTEVTRSILKTMKAVFPEIYIFPVEYRKMPWLYDRRNLIVIATRKPTKLTAQDLVKRAEEMVKEGKIKIPQLPNYAADLYLRQIPFMDVPILTDDYAPVEFLNP